MRHSQKVQPLMGTWSATLGVGERAIVAIAPSSDCRQRYRLQAALCVLPRGGHDSLFSARVASQALASSRVKE